MRRMILAFPLPLVLAACATTAPAPPPPVTPSAPAPQPAEAGLGQVMDHDAPSLLALLGQPALDLREGPARKLQFRGAACVLDAYLYPPKEGAGAATVTYLDARTPQGGDYDRASCIAALARR